MVLLDVQGALQALASGDGYSQIPIPWDLCRLAFALCAFFLLVLAVCDLIRTHLLTLCIPVPQVCPVPPALRAQPPVGLRHGKLCDAFSGLAARAKIRSGERGHGRREAYAPVTRYVSFWKCIR